ncbi:MAG TPA: TIM barrel protein, partial [Limnochordia bacterium]
MSLLSVTTWSLHRNLGPLRHVRRGEDGRLVSAIQPQPETISLLDLPQRLAALGFEAVDVCHFHFPRTDPDYLAALRDACAAASIQFFSLLIDAGDITHPDPAVRADDLGFIRRWIDVAAACDARCARVIAGDAPPDDAAARTLAIEQLRDLTAYGKARGVQVLTENFHRLASTAANVHALLDGVPGLGLVADFGNFRGADRDDALASILPRASSVHAKIDVAADGTWEVARFERHMEMARAA